MVFSNCKYLTALYNYFFSTIDKVNNQAVHFPEVIVHRLSHIPTLFCNFPEKSHDHISTGSRCHVQLLANGYCQHSAHMFHY